MRKNLGGALREEVEPEILKLALRQKELSFSEIEKALVPKYSTNTVSKYLRFLTIGRFMEEKGVKIDGKYRPRYSITKKGRKLLLGKMVKVSLDSTEAILILGDDNLKFLVETTGKYHELLIRKFGKDVSGPAYVLIGKDGKVDVQPAKEVKP